MASRDRASRYFAGRAFESANSESSGSDGQENVTALPGTSESTKSTEKNKAQLAANAVTRSRPRIQARVIVPATSSSVVKKPSKPEGFVLVRDEIDVDEVGIEGSDNGRAPSSDDSSDENSSGNGSSSGNSSESDSDSETNPHQLPARPEKAPEPRSPSPVRGPVFVPKSERHALLAAERKRIEEERREASRTNVRSNRMEQEKNELLKRSRKDALQEVVEDRGLEDIPDDTDRPENRETEYEMWKVRELKRVMRDLGIDLVDNEQKPVELQPSSNEVPEDSAASAKRKPGYLQKFYKMGAFFMECGEDGRYREKIYNRDYTLGTAEDLIERKNLPKPLQVRRGELGKAGRSKYTHLADNDTAARFSKEIRSDAELRQKLDVMHERRSRPRDKDHHPR